MNASMKILENQMGHIILAIQRQSSKTLPNDTKEITRDCETRSLSYEKELVDGDKNELEIEEELSKPQKEVSKIVQGRITPRNPPPPL